MKNTNKAKNKFISAKQTRSNSSTFQQTQNAEILGYSYVLANAIFGIMAFA